MTVRIIIGDCRQRLAGLPSKSVNTCVTSPPYFGLRDYGHDGQIGLEATPNDFVAQMVEVFREVRRVLRDDGTLWLNLGDSYASGTKGSGGVGKGTLNCGQHHNAVSTQNQKLGDVKRFDLDAMGLKPKDLIGIPWRVAFALQADGWYLRQDIIWSKPNPMPESVRDRCTKAHEYVFLLSKGPRYHFDAEAISEPAIHAGDVKTNSGGKNAQMGEHGATRGGFMKEGGVTVKDTRNKRTVWTVPSAPFSGAHFATYPPELIEPCILAGCPVGGTVLDPFGGAGTTGLVADRLQRDAVLIELNPEYAEIARRRLQGDGGMFSDVEAA